MREPLRSSKQALLREVRVSSVFHVKRFPVPLLLPLLLFSTPALAQQSHPQANAGLVVGAAGVGQDGEFWQKTQFHLGLRADVLFGRASPADWGFGPVVNLSTNRFDTYQVGAGVSALAPVSEYLPLVFSVGPQVTRGDSTEAGAFASIFWGSRSFNYHGWYGMAGGLLLEGRAGFGETKERTIVIAAHLDLQVLSLPVLMLINAFR